MNHKEGSMENPNAIHIYASVYKKYASGDKFIAKVNIYTPTLFITFYLY